MPAERNAFKLGLTMIVFFALLVGVLVFLAPTAPGDLVFRVRFPVEEQGIPLGEGGPVVCGGVPVGTIRSVSLLRMVNPDSDVENLYTVVTAAVSSAIGLKEDCRIMPSGQLLGGAGQLLIVDCGDGKPVQADQLLDGRPAPTIANLTAMLAEQIDPKNPVGLLAMVKGQLDVSDARSLLGKIHASLDDVNAMTVSLAGEFDAQEKAALLAKFHAILDHVNEMTNVLRGQMDTAVDAALLAKVHQALDSLNSGLQTAVGLLDENREPVRETLLHVRNTSQILEEQIAARLAQQFDPADAASLLTRIHQAIVRLGSSLEDINTITGGVRDVIVLNKNNLDAMIANLKETSDHLKAGSKEIRLQPWLLLYTPTADEAAEAKLFGATRAFAEAATRLDDAIGRLQALSDASVGTAGDQEELERIRVELKDTFGKFSEAEDQLWKQLRIK